MNRNYRIVIQWDPSDKIYIAEVPQLKRCMAHGDTPEEAAREIQTSIEIWLENATEMGIPIPEPEIYSDAA